MLSRLLTVVGAIELRPPPQPAPPDEERDGAEDQHGGETGAHADAGDLATREAPGGRRGRRVGARRGHGRGRGCAGGAAARRGCRGDGAARVALAQLREQPGRRWGLEGLARRLVAHALAVVGRVAACPAVGRRVEYGVWGGHAGTAADGGAGRLVFDLRVGAARDISTAR